MNKTKLAISFDPGVTHFGVAGVSYDGKMVGLEFHKTFDIRGDRGQPDPIKLEAALNEVLGRADIMQRKYSEQIWYVIEYQPPLATRSNPGLVRQNTYVEAFVEGWLRFGLQNVIKVAPSAVKRHFKFPKSECQYRSNKQFSMKLVKDMSGIPVNDHISDCVLNAVYCLREKV